MQNPRINDQARRQANPLIPLNLISDQTLKAINQASAEDDDWLYDNFKKPNGRRRKSITGFLLFDGRSYPLKPLGRLASEIAGDPLVDNPVPSRFRRYFEGLGFQSVRSMKNESEEAAERQKRLAEVWSRPQQAKFRREVFELYGAKCIVSGCESLVAVEAAHLLPIAKKGGDQAWNGIPLRADLHRLFDANLMNINFKDWTLQFAVTEKEHFKRFDGRDISKVIKASGHETHVAEMLRKRIKKQS